MTTKQRLSFGAHVREKRTEAGFGLREFAGLVGISPSYLSQIEQDQVDPPANEHIEIIADQLEEDFAELVFLAGRLTDELQQLVACQPNEIKSLILAAKNLSSQQVNSIAKRMQEMNKASQR